MRLYVCICKDRQPGSNRWTLRAGVNQTNILPLSRSEPRPAAARREAERAFGPLNWISGEEAGADERNQYVIQVAAIEVTGV